MMLIYGIVFLPNIVLDYFLKRECRAALGLRGRVRTEHYEAVPGSTPLGEDGDGTLLDVLADDALPDADDGLLQDDVQREVYTAIDRLPDKVAGVIRSHCLEGIPQGELAAQMGVSSERVRQIKCKGFAKLRKDPQLRRLVDEACCWRYKGVRSFYRDRTSVTEMAALRRIGGG